MAHNIMERDNLFTVRKPAWHGLGQVLPQHPSREEAKAIAHPWEPQSEPVYRRVTAPVQHWHHLQCPDGCDQETELVTTHEEVNDFQGIARSDTGDLLGVVPSTYEVVSNETLYDIAEAIQGEGAEVLFETGGSLKNGRKVWLLLRFEEPLRLGGRHGTETIPYYALQNSHDGTGAFRGQATMTAIVCDNTAQMADLDAKARGTEFVFRHTKNVGERIEEAKVALAGWRESVETFNRMADFLINTPITAKHRQLFVEEFIPMPQQTMISERVRNNIEEGRRRLNSIFDSPTQESVKDTAYGLVQASVEYHQWYRRARSEESRFQRAYLDRSRFTADAVALAQEVASF